MSAFKAVNNKKMYEDDAWLGTLPFVQGLNLCKKINGIILPFGSTNYTVIVYTSPDKSASIL